MNLTQLTTAASLAQSAWSKFSDYRDEKARAAFASLEDAAKKASASVNTDALPRTRQEASAISQAARVRLERALTEMDDTAHEKYATVAHLVEEKSAAARKQAAKKLTKKQKKKSTKLLPVLGLTALLAAGLGGAYYWLRGKDVPATTPPRVEDFGANKVAKEEGSTLVYSTTTEEPAQRDEELLTSIEDQLAQHAENEADSAEGTEGETSANQN